MTVPGLRGDLRVDVIAELVPGRLRPDSVSCCAHKPVGKEIGRSVCSDRTVDRQPAGCVLGPLLAVQNAVFYSRLKLRCKAQRILEVWAGDDRVPGPFELAFALGGENIPP